MGRADVLCLPSNGSFGPRADVITRCRTYEIPHLICYELVWTDKPLILNATAFAHGLLIITVGVKVVQK
jgi:hypothetical protein